MKNLLNFIILTIGLFLVTNQISAQVVPFTDDFESYVSPPDAGFINPGVWLTFSANTGPFGNQFLGGGGGDAENRPSTFISSIQTDAAGNQFLLVANNYYDGSHGDGSGNFIETRVFQEFFLSADDLDKDFTFTFDSQTNDGMPINSADVQTVEAFVRIALPDFSSITDAAFNTQSITSSTTNSIQFTTDTADPSIQAGSILQVGFLSRVRNGGPSFVQYDNVSLVCTPEPIVAPIPTLGEWGLILMSMSLFIVGLVYIRQSSLQPVQQKK